VSRWGAQGEGHQWPLRVGCGVQMSVSSEQGMGKGFLLRAQRLGVAAQAGGLLVVGFYPLMPGHRDVPMWEFGTGMAIAGLATIVAAVVPWRRWLSLGSGVYLLYGWSAVLLGLIAWIVALTGGDSSPLWLLYVPVTVFAAAVYGRRAVVGTFAVVVAITASLAVAGVGSHDVADLVLRVSVMVITMVLGLFLLHERGLQVRLRRATSERAERIEAEFRVLADGIPMGVFAVDVASSSPRVTYANSRARDLYQAVARLDGHADADSCFNEIYWEDRDDVRRMVALMMQDKKPVTIRHRLERNGGRLVWLETRLSPICGRDGAITRILGVVDDITQRKRHEERLAHQAAHDSLTGLANRSRLAEVTTSALAWARCSKAGVAICYCDLDRFKQVNDTLGHAVGDMVLEEAAARLRGVLRSQDTGFRIGGDEFLVVCEGITEQDARGVALRLCGELSRPIITADGTEIVLSASIGVAFSGDGDVSPDVLLLEADHAMYEGKSLGEPCVHVLAGVM